MDIAQEKQSLKERQEAVVKDMNENIAQRQALEARFRELVREADMLNGEARLLNRLGGDNPDKPA